MGLFSRHSFGPDDLRDRDYVLTGCPLVAQDDKVVLVDATVRLAVRQPTDDKDLVLGYNPAEEIATHAVCVVVLRLMAAAVPSDELLVGRARVTEALEQGLAFAPVGTGVEARVLSVEVRPYDADLASYRHEFRVVGT
jgi:hypothetical protein